MKTSTALLLGVFACHCSFSETQAAYTIVENFQSYQITGDQDVLTEGGLLYAYNMGGSASNVTLNGVSFTAQGGSAGTGTHTYGSITCTPSNYSFGNATPAGSSTGYIPAGSPARDALTGSYTNLLEGGVSASGNAGPAVTLTLNGLEAGHTYALQIWFNDSRTGNTSLQSSIRFSDQGSGEAFYANRNNGATNDYLGSYVTVKFTVDSDSQSFLLSNGSYVMFNALQVRDITIPEPSTAMLSALALMGVALRRKK